VNDAADNLALARRIDKACDAFEAAWNSGARPRIENVLKDQRADEFREFLQALLTLEIELREHSSEAVRVEDLLQRFPQHTDIVETAFQAAHESVSLTGLSMNDSGVRTLTEYDEDGSRRLPLPQKFGRYRIGGILGQGAMGCVRLAEDTELQRQVALKIPRFPDGDADFQERFQREARSAAQLRHANICPIYDVGETNGIRYIAMAYIDGRPLSDYVQPEPVLSDRRIATLIIKLSRAVQHAHDHGIVHRDLKPANVMLDGSQEPIIMDFGLAVQLRENADVRLTRTGTQMGSPAYMSPEQVEGDPSKIGPATDIYSLGVLTYELLTGVTPYRGGVASVLTQILMRDPDPPSTHRPDLPVGLEELCLKMIARQPTDRFESMGAVADAWLEFLRRTSPGTDLNDSGPLPTIPARVQRECAHCGNSLRLVRSHAGGAVRCPKCEGKLSVAADLSTVAPFVPASQRNAEQATLRVSDSDTEPGITLGPKRIQTRPSDASGQLDHRSRHSAPAQTGQRSHTAEDPQPTSESLPRGAPSHVLVVGLCLAILASLIGWVVWPSGSDPDSATTALNSGTDVPPEDPADTADAAGAAVIPETEFESVIAVIADRVVDELAEMEVTIEFLPGHGLASSDFELRLDTDAPAGMTLAAQSGLVQWRPEESQGPGNYPVQVELVRKSSQRVAAIQEFRVEVREVNQKPVLRIPEVLTTVARGDTLQLQAQGSDADVPPNRLGYELAGTIPPGASIDPQSGRLTWSVSATAALRKYQFTVRLSDTAIPPQTDTVSVEVSVTPALARSPVNPTDIPRLQREWASFVNARPVMTDSVGMTHALIPAGEFLMGSPETEESRDARETQHLVQITKPFYMSQHEVSRSTFRAFVQAMGDDYRTEPEQSGAGGTGRLANAKGTSRDPKFNWLDTGETQTDQHPVVNISWNDAQEFCRWMTQQEGLTYRLPTEAEWEFACRAGTVERYWFGETPQDFQTLANTSGAAPAANQQAGRDVFRFTSPRGTFKPNPFGLFDMHGNVQEWCSDWYGRDYYRASAKALSPSGPGVGTMRITRGGSCHIPASGCRSARRGNRSPTAGYDCVGFRVVVEP
jgi:formylglycine-generating enzyme required for sulfatase activity/serine/threonine protein kinase